MKTSKLIGIALATSLMALGATAIFAQQPNGLHHSNGGQVHQMYIDENGDGINDNMPYMHHQGMSNGGSRHSQNYSGAGHQNGGQGMHNCNQGMHNSGMMGCDYGIGYQDHMGYLGRMNGSSGMGGSHGSQGSMGRY